MKNKRTGPLKHIQHADVITARISRLTKFVMNLMKNMPIKQSAHHHNEQKGHA
ncbi:hypothetical protein [Xenorhabdus budapestensis]|uniref:hypothetical protein n=1 Tax=Xenorhabdus budapestensis TaxID=290110 RepID=UPI0030DA2F4E